MPAVSAAKQTVLRSSPHSAKVGILVHRPLILKGGQVQGSPADGAGTIVLSVTVDNGTPRADYAVVAGSTAGGDDGGRTRLKSWSGSTATLAANNIEWTSYPHVSILEMIDPVSIIPDRKNDLMDGTKAYSDENEQQHPLGLIGPPGWGYTSEAIRFYARRQAVASGASITGHSWVFPSGSPGSSSQKGSAGSPIEVTWSSATGHVPHYMRYTQTDSNGKTHTRYNPVWVLDQFEDAYCDFEIEDCSGDTSAGTWTAKFRIHGDATTDEFPSNAMVVMISRSVYQGAQQDIGGNWSWRENVLFFGWIVAGTTFKDDEGGSVSFEAHGPVAMMERLTSWPANLNDRANPSKWDQIKNMTCDLAAFHILTERSTFHKICDIVLSGNTKRLRYVDIPETSIRDQLDNYCLSPIGARVLSDRQGRIYLSRNVNKRPVSERSSIATVMDVALQDLRANPGLELGVEEMRPRVAQVDFIAFNYSGLDVSPLYSLALENQFPHGDIQKIDGVRADSQSEANTLSGLYLAELNNKFIDNSLAFWNYPIFDIAPEEYLTLTIAASQNKRGIAWNQQKLLPRSVSVEYDQEAESLFWTVVAEKDSFGPPGVGGGYASERPRARVTYPPDPDQAVVGFASFWFRGAQDSSWENRGLLGSVNAGIVDPWWWTTQKQNTDDPNKAIVIAVGQSLGIYRSTDGGYSWRQKTVGAPANTWSDTTPPDSDQTHFVWVWGDRFQNSRFYALAYFQEPDSGDGMYRAWMYVTDDDFSSGVWYPLYDGITLPDEVRPLGVVSNFDKILVTVWQDISGTQTLSLQRWDTTPVYQAAFSLGNATEAQVDANTYIAYPAAVTDDANLWYVWGRLQSPQGLSDPEHVILTPNAGVSWQSVENSWGTRYCMSFFAGKGSSRALKAVRSA